MLTKNGELLIWKSFKLWLRQRIFGCVKNELPIVFNLRIIIGHYILRGMGEETTRLMKEIEDMRIKLERDTFTIILEVVRREIRFDSFAKKLEQIEAHITKPQDDAS